MKAVAAPQAYLRAGPRRANDGRPARVTHARRRPARNLGVSAGARIELASWLVFSDGKGALERDSRGGWGNRLGRVQLGPLRQVRRVRQVRQVRRVRRVRQVRRVRRVRQVRRVRRQALLSHPSHPSQPSHGPVAAPQGRDAWRGSRSRRRRRTCSRGGPRSAPGRRRRSRAASGPRGG